MMTPATNASGKPVAFTSWERALEHCIKGAAWADRDLRDTRAKDYYRTDPEHAEQMLRELAEAHEDAGGSAAPILALVEQMHEWYESTQRDPFGLDDEPETDSEPEAATGSPLEARIAEAVALLEANGYRVQKKAAKKMHKRQEVETFTPEQVRDILAELDPTRPDHARNRALLALMYASGLRIGEAVRLKTDSIVKHANGMALVRVPCAPGCKTGARDVPVALLDSDGRPTMLGAELEAWMKKRYDLGPWLFNTYTGEHVHPNSVNRSMKNAAKKAGITKRVHAHMFRHTAATERARAGWERRDVQAFLGHSDERTTGIYIAAADTARLEKLTEAMR